MAEIVFIYEGKSMIIQCNIEQKMKDICITLSNKINKDINALTFLYGGRILNLDKKFNEITKENKITILVYKDEEENEVCSESKSILNNKKLDEIISLNNKINKILIGLNNQLVSIIKNLINEKDINNANIQLGNIIIEIKKINEDIKNINNKLNIMKINDIHNINLKANKINDNIKIGNKSINNEIICIYNKKEDEISLLYDYEKLENWSGEYKKYFIEGKNEMNGDNIEIYINDRKIVFDYKYKSNEKGEIKVKFKFNKLLTSTFCMFRGCSSLESIDLSSFNTINVNNMYCMFFGCSSLKSIDLFKSNTYNVKDMYGMFFGCSSLKLLDLSLFNTINVNNMGWFFSGCSSLESINLLSFNTINVKTMEGMFNGCSSLKSIDLSSFNTINVNDMYGMFSGCSSLKLLDLSSFNTINVNSFGYMFNGCSSLISIDLSSFNTAKVNNIYDMFRGCSSLKKENIKINESESKILNQLNNN